MTGMIEIKIPRLLKERKLTATDLMYGARVAPGTAYKLASEEECSKMTGISFDVLFRVCKYLEVDIGEVLVIEANEG